MKIISKLFDHSEIIVTGHYDFYVVDDITHWAIVDARLE